MRSLPPLRRIKAFARVFRIFGRLLAVGCLVGCGAPVATPTPLPAAGSPSPTALPRRTSQPHRTGTATPAGDTQGRLPRGCPPLCSGVNLYRADLTGFDLSGADLSGAYLRLADLQEANLHGANLRLALLDGANLQGARLSEASLRQAQLRPALPEGSPCPGLEATTAAPGEARSCVTRLGEADLHGADLSGADLREADLHAADLREANLREADLRAADLREADLGRADLRGADLREADLTGASLRQADLWGADLRQAKVTEEQLSQVSIDRGGVTPGAPLNCTRYQPPDTYGPVWEIEVEAGGKVWLSAFQGAGQFDLRTGTWIPYTPDMGLRYERVQSITIEPDGPVWFAFWEEGVARFDRHSWTRFSTGDGLISNRVWNVSIAPDGSVWFATRQGASHWDRQTDTWTPYTQENGLVSDDVTNVLFTPDGRIWFAHMTGLTSWLPALSEDEEDEWDTYLGVRYLGSTEALVADDGRLWLGQVVYDPEQGEWIDTVYREIEVQGLAVDSQGGLWIGRPDGAFYIPDPLSSPRQDWQHYSVAEGLPGNNVLVVVLEADDVVWFGTENGASRCTVEIHPRPRGSPAP